MGGCMSVEVTVESKPAKGSSISGKKSSGSGSGGGSARTDKKVSGGAPSSSGKKSAGTDNNRVMVKSGSESEPADGTAKPDATSLRKFKLAELKSATSSFSRKNLLGEGSFGEVFRGLVPDKATGESIKVAVKVLNPESSQGMDEWLQEVLLLPSVAHPNLIRLVGFCSEKGEAMLVYELCENGSLDDRLFPEGKAQVLSWKERADIIHGVANALVHLHKSRIIHRDLKPGNILLGANMEAKVTDFGMAKQANNGETHLSTRVMGTMGYLDPAYMETGCLREKSDVYSFGVILLQVLTGKEAVDDHNQKLSHVMYDLLHPNITDPAKWIDPALEGIYSRKGALMMAAIAKRCVEDASEARPEMTDIAEFLKDVPRQ